MINDIINLTWKELHDKIRKLRDKRSAPQPTKVNSKSEQFVGILQKRYGYSKDKATSELNKHYSKILLG